MTPGSMADTVEPNGCQVLGLKMPDAVWQPGSGSMLQ